MPFEFETLLISPAAFERIVLVARNLKRLGIEVSVRLWILRSTKNRLDGFDFDMVVSTFGQSLSPGNEQRAFWGSDAAARQRQPKSGGD